MQSPDRDKDEGIDTRIEDLQGLLDQRNPQEAKKALQTLLDGPLSLTPTDTEEGPRYEVRGNTAVGAVFTREGVPTRVRTGVAALKGRSPGPLDDGDRVT